DGAGATCGRPVAAGPRRRVCVAAGVGVGSRTGRCCTDRASGRPRVRGKSTSCRAAALAGSHTPGGTRRRPMAAEFIVLSHREPYAEVETPEGVELRRKTNGVFATLDSVMRERGGVWIAWAEREGGRPFAERVAVPSGGHAQAY